MLGFDYFFLGGKGIKSNGAECQEGGRVIALQAFRSRPNLEEGGNNKNNLRCCAADREIFLLAFSENGIHRY